MDFAKKQLEKYGWKEGEGVGKEGNKGIATAIKPKCKNGKEGMGFNVAKDLVDPWWTKAYNDSLKRINVNDCPDESRNENVLVSFGGDDEESGERPLEKIMKRAAKSNFVEFSKGATLTNGKMESKSSDEDDSSASESESGAKRTKDLTDEELFKACGGRTAHKSARFGHKLNGKLARLAAQEEKLFATSNISDKSEVIQGCKRKCDS